MISKYKISYNILNYLLSFSLVILFAVLGCSSSRQKVGPFSTPGVKQERIIAGVDSAVLCKDRKAIVDRGGSTGGGGGDCVCRRAYCAGGRQHIVTTGQGPANRESAGDSTRSVTKPGVGEAASVGYNEGQLYFDGVA